MCYIIHASVDRNCLWKIATDRRVHGKFCEINQSVFKENYLKPSKFELVCSLQSSCRWTIADDVQLRAGVGDKNEDRMEMEGGLFADDIAVLGNNREDIDGLAKNLIREQLISLKVTEAFASTIGVERSRSGETNSHASAPQEPQ